MINLNGSLSRSLILFLACLTISLTFYSCKKEKETPVATGTISGRVSDEFGSPLADVTMTLDGKKPRFVVTNAAGEFAFRGVIVGDYHVLASKDKYISETKAVTVTQDNKSMVDVQLRVGEATLDINKETLSYSFKNSANAVEVNSNSAWLVETSADWLIPEVSSGQGHQTATIHAKENPTEEVRTATITISTGSLSKIISVTQDFKLKLLSVSLTQPISDSVVLHFNKQVDEIRIDALDQFCQTTIRYPARPGASEVRFAYSCARMGGSYPFRLQLKDKLETYTEEFTADFFSKRLAFTREDYIGYPNCYVFEDTKTLWICGIDERVIQEVDIEAFQVIRTYTVPIRVLRLSYNPYNRLIYIIGESADFYMLDPAAHKVAGKKTIVPIRGDDPDYPEIYPTMMVFSKSGVGVMTIQGSGPYPGTWKMIDSRKDHLIYYSKNKNAMEDIGDMDPSADQNRILMKPNYSNDLYNFDPLTDNMITILPPVPGGVSHVIPSKKSGNMIFIQVYHQYVYNPGTNYVSQISYIGHAYQGDFSYRPNEENIVYAFDANSYLQVLDYRTGSTIIQFPVLAGERIGQVFSTTDGKYLIASNGTTVYRFDTELLSRRNGSKSAMMKMKSAFMK